MRSISNWLDRFCYKHPKLALPNFMLYIVMGSAAVALFDAFSMSGSAGFSNLFSFNRDLILSGQIWRIFTFLFVPNGGNLILTAISLYFYYFIASSLEQQWGSAKFTVYYAIGLIANILVGLAVGYASIFYLNMALFFAFATLYPNMQVMLFFIIPIKIKWLAYFDLAFFAFEIFNFFLQGAPQFALIPVVALLNYLLFFGADLLDVFQQKKKQASHRQNHRTVNFQSAQQHAKEKRGYLHKCAVCGKTDVSNPTLEFRYCSKCKGYYCYCSEHIASHVHIE